MGFTAIIAFHPPFAAPVDLDVVQVNRRGQSQKRQLGGRGDRKIPVGTAIERGIANGNLAVQRRQIHHAIYDFGASTGLQVHSSGQAAFEILEVLEGGEIDAAEATSNRTEPSFQSLAG